MHKLHHGVPDLALAAFQPLVDLGESPHANMTARAVTHWLSRECFGDWGACMGLYGATRRLLGLGGLEVAETADLVVSQHPRWTALQRAERAGTLSAPERLFFARLLVFCGLHADARRVASVARGDASIELGGLWISSEADWLVEPGRWGPDPYGVSFRRALPGASSNEEAGASGPRHRDADVAYVRRLTG